MTALIHHPVPHSIEFHATLLQMMTSGDLWTQTRRRSRLSEPVAWQAVAAALLRTATDMSWPEIAEVLGKNNRSSPITSFRRVRPAAEWGERATAVLDAYKEACARREWIRPPLEDWRWVEAWEDMKKEPA